MKFLSGLGPLLSLATLSYAASSQSVLGSVQDHGRQVSAYTAPYDDGLFTPIEHLSALSVESFTTLGHPYFPKHSMRIKKSQFCDGTVKLVANSVPCPFNF